MKKLFLLILAIYCPLSFAAPIIETIQLNHRLANEVLPEVQAFLPENATARAFNELIIIKAEKNEIETLRQLVHKLDTPPQHLLITVLKSYDTISDRRNTALHGNIELSNNHLAGQVALEGWSTKDNKNHDQYFQARGLAGKPVLITMGESIPQQEQYLVLRHDGDLAINEATHYLDINSGFEAIATILPNHQTIIEIHPAFGHYNEPNGVIQHSQLISTVSGEIDTWLEVGQVHSKKNIEKLGTTSYHSDSQKQQSIYIKVEQLN